MYPFANAYFRMIRVLDILDADHDWIISPWEITTAPAALRRLDNNHDGKLSPEECGFYLGANPKINLDPPRVQLERLRFMRLNPVLAALDSDHDGEISADEIKNSSAALRTLDQNRDGSLTPDRGCFRPVDSQTAHNPTGPHNCYPRVLENAVLQWVATYGYFAIFSLLVLGIVGLPVPDEFLLTGCGFLVFQGHLRLIPTFASALAGSACPASPAATSSAAPSDGEFLPLARGPLAAHQR